ncbi:MAG: hypothetical protein HRT89_19435, partial [Lentisphaeria bacterium]|nr:hypothetical protein [Lentisphaeria bacterium]
MKQKQAIAYLLSAKLFSLFAEPQDPPDIPGYSLPISGKPETRGFSMDYMDMSVLFLALSITTYFTLKKRSRKGIFWTSLFSLGYFGFYRQGCVCPIGSIQNVAEALFSPTYVAGL